MKIYFSKNNTRLNGVAYPIETVSGMVCVNPLYPVQLSEESVVMIDSGGFQDRTRGRRLTYPDALARQIALSERIGGAHSWEIVAYDLIGCSRTTMEANEYLVGACPPWATPVYVLQGDTAYGFLNCLNALPDGVVIAVGGVALAGRVKQEERRLLAILRVISTRLIEKKIPRLHILGVGTIRILLECREIVGREIELSLDTSSYEVNSVMGRVLGDDGVWVRRYEKHEKNVTYFPASLALQNARKAQELLL